MIAPLQGGVASAERVRSVLEEVFARPEFKPETNPVQAWIQELLHWLGTLFVDALSNVPVIQLFYVLLGVVAGVLLWLVVRGSVSRWRRRGAVLPAGAETRRASRVARLRAEARSAEACGDRVLALRLYFWALVIGLSERGDLEYRDAWTNRELFERGAPRSDAARLLRPLVPDLDARSFGRVPAGAADVERLASLCDRHLGALPT